MKKSKVHYITAVGLMIALVFISHQISIKIPVAVGDNPARIHFGNIFCLFGGYLLGPLGGGIAAGAGAMLYDFTDPAYIASAPFTFISKFAMGFICGKIAYMAKSGGKNAKFNIIGGIAGIAGYMVLYLSKSFVTDIYFKMLEMPVAKINLATRAASSTVNGIIAVAIAVPLGLIIRRALEAGNLMDKIRYDGGK